MAIHASSTSGVSHRVSTGRLLGVGVHAWMVSMASAAKMVRRGLQNIRRFDLFDYILI